MPIASLATITLDCTHAAPLARFWAQALGWTVRPYDSHEIARLAELGHTPETDPTVAVDSPDGSLALFCVEVPEPKVRKNRMHLDLMLTSSEHLDQLMDLGAAIVDRQPDWTVMADPEGNEFCVFGVGPPAE